MIGFPVANAKSDGCPESSSCTNNGICHFAGNTWLKIVCRPLMQLA